MKNHLRLLTFAMCGALFACSSDDGESTGSGGGTNGAGGSNGGGNRTEVFGVLLTSANSDAFSVDYEYNYCAPGESDADCEASLSGAGTAMPFGTNPFLTVETPVSADTDRLFLSWTVTTGTGTLDIVRASVDEEDEASVLNTFRSISVSAGDTDAAVYALQ